MKKLAHWIKQITPILLKRDQYRGLKLRTLIAVLVTKALFPNVNITISRTPTGDGKERVNVKGR